MAPWLQDLILSGLPDSLARHYRVTSTGRDFGYSRVPVRPSGRPQRRLEYVGVV
jgi:hypothetical protein